MDGSSGLEEALEVRPDCPLPAPTDTGDKRGHELENAGWLVLSIALLPAHSGACGVRKLDHAVDLGIHREVGDPTIGIAATRGVCTEAGAADGIRRGARRRDSASDATMSNRWSGARPSFDTPHGFPQTRPPSWSPTAGFARLRGRAAPPHLVDATGPASRLGARRLDASGRGSGPPIKESTPVVTGDR